MLTTNVNENFAFKISPACEFFHYFMDSKTAVRYAKCIMEDNSWLWGLDLILYRHLDFRVAIINNMNIKHFIKGASYKDRPDKSPMQGYENLLKKYNDARENLEKLPSAFYYIFENEAPYKSKPPLVPELQDDEDSRLSQSLPS